MADRTVTVKLSVDASGFKSAMAQAGTMASAAAKATSTAWKGSGAAAAGAAQRVGTPWQAAGAAAATAGGKAAAPWAQAGSTAASAGRSAAAPWAQAGATAATSGRNAAAPWAQSGATAAAAGRQVQAPWQASGATAQAAATSVGTTWQAAGSTATSAGRGIAAPWQAAGSTAAAAADTSVSAWGRVKGTMGEVIQKQKDHQAEWSRVSSAAMIGGAGVVAAVGGMAKAAMSWESAWTGVKKTVDGTPEQLGAVEDGLRGLARQLPASHEQIAAVAEAAGQLGVKTGDIVAFTKTMIDMGESTNLTADEAATSISRFTNIMGTVGRIGSSAYSRVGSAMVDLGNHFATTESEINAMSLRLAGAGRQMNMTEGDVLGMAAAMSSVGIEAEAGGTAMSTSLKKIDNAVRAGGQNLDQFAQVAGKSAQDFAQTWREHPSQALSEFVQGLGQVQDSGGSVSQTLSELGIKGIREQDTFLRLAGASDILTEALDTGNSAFEVNAALAEEAGKRYETTESQVRIAWNQIKDSAITAGASILPIVADVMHAVGGIADAFGRIPAPVSGALAVLGGVAGVALLGVGGIMKLVSAAAETKAAFDTLGVSGDLVKGKLSGLGRVAAGVGAAIGGLAVASNIAKSFGDPQVASVSAFTNALAGVSPRIEDIDRKFKEADFTNGRGEWTLAGTEMGINSIGDAMDRVSQMTPGEGIKRFINGFAGAQTAGQKLEEQIGNIDQALAGMYSSGNYEGAAQAFQQIVESGKQAGMSVEDVASQFPKLRDAVDDYATSVGVSLSDQEKLDAMMGNIPPKLAEAAGGADKAAKGISGMGDAADDTADSLADIVKSMTDLGMIAMDKGKAMADFEQAISDVGSTMKEIADSGGKMGAVLNAAGDGFDLTTEAGRKAQEALFAVARAGIDVAESMAEGNESQEEVQAQLQRTYDQLIASAGQMGITGAAADTLARSVMGIPEGKSIETWMSEAAQQTANQTADAVSSIPDTKTVTTWMDDTAMQTALQTAGAAQGIPADVTISSFMSSLAKDKADETTAAVLGIPEGKSISSWMSENGIHTANDMRDALGRVPEQKNVDVRAQSSGTQKAQQDIDWIAGHDVFIDVLVRTKSIVTAAATAGVASWFGKWGRKRALGGPVAPTPGERIPGYAGGGLIPGRRPANRLYDDRMAVVTDTGEPIRVQSSEFISTSESTRRNLAALHAGNQGARLVVDQGSTTRGLATGGAVSPSVRAQAVSTWRARAARLGAQYPGYLFFEDGTFKAVNGKQGGVWDPRLLPDNRGATTSKVSLPRAASTASTAGANWRARAALMPRNGNQYFEDGTYRSPNGGGGIWDQQIYREQYGSRSTSRVSSSTARGSTIKATSAAANWRARAAQQPRNGNQYFEDGTYRTPSGGGGIWDQQIYNEMKARVRNAGYEAALAKAREHDAKISKSLPSYIRNWMTRATQLRRQHPDRRYYEDGTWGYRDGRKGGGVWDQRIIDYGKAEKARRAAAQKAAEDAKKAQQKYQAVLSQSKKSTIKPAATAQTAVLSQAEMKRAEVYTIRYGKGTSGKTGIVDFKAEPKSFADTTGGADTVAAAVSEAISAWQPVVQIGEREIIGTMQAASRRLVTR